VVHYSVSDLLTALLDRDTFLSWDAQGAAESVLTGEGRVNGRRVALVASDFSFQGGSIGLVAGERLTRAAERATTSGLPLIALPASGGTRMREGTAAFLQMLKVTAAVIAHKAAGLPYLVYLRHPTTGGVLASWASLGQVTLAEPGALIGFLGPRVGQALTGRPFPPGVQSAENLHAHGLIDAVVDIPGLAPRVARFLAALPDHASPSPEAERAAPAARAPAPSASNGLAGPVDGWESVTRTRQPAYPRGLEFLRATATEVEVVAAAGGLLLALATVRGAPVVAGVQRGEGTFGIHGLDLVLRGSRLAADLRLPLVTVIDTQGAEVSVAAEEAGIAGRIARCLEALMTLPVPRVSVLLGQGTGGGALALLPADRVLAAPDGWLAPLAPEGASAIVYRDTAHAPQMARSQGITARELAAIGAVDVIARVGSDPGTGLGAALADELADLTAMDPRARRAARLGRLRGLGI